MTDGEIRNVAIKIQTIAACYTGASPVYTGCERWHKQWLATKRLLDTGRFTLSIPLGVNRRQGVFLFVGGSNNSRRRPSIVH
jgi:hypothetical protein